MAFMVHDFYFDCKYLGGYYHLRVRTLHFSIMTLEQTELSFLVNKPHSKSPNFICLGHYFVYPDRFWFDDVFAEQTLLGLVTEYCLNYIFLLFFIITTEQGPS